MRNIYGIFVSFAVYVFILNDSQVLAKIPDKVLLITTGSSYGSYYKTGMSLCKILQEKEDEYDFKCLSRPSEGSTQNIEIVLNDDTAFGISQSDVFLSAPQKEDLSVVAFLFEEPVFIIASQNSSAMSFNDVLLQKKVNIGSAGSGSNRTVREIFRIKGWDRQDLIEAGNYEITSLICKNYIDVSFFLLADPSNFISHILDKCEGKIIGVPQEFIEKISKEMPGVKPYTIKAKFYGPNQEDTQTIATKAILFTSKKTSPDLVYNVLKGIFENNAILKNNDLLSSMKIRDFFESSDALPLHPGAQKFYNEYKER